MLFPFRTSSIFRNRWIALLWAAGICWTAAQFAGGDEAAAPADEAQMNAMQDALKALEAQR